MAKGPPSGRGGGQGVPEVMEIEEASLESTRLDEVAQ